MRPSPRRSPRRSAATASPRTDRARRGGGRRRRPEVLAGYLERLESRSMMAVDPGMTLVGTTAPPWNMQYDNANKPVVSDTGYLAGRYASPGTNPFAALTAGGNINLPYTVNGSPAFSQPVQTSDWWSNLMLRMDPQQASNASGTFDFQYANATLFSEPVALKFHNQYYATDSSPWVQGLGILNPGSFGVDPGQVGPNDNTARRNYGWPDTMPLVVGIGGNTQTNTDTRAQEITPLGTAGSNPTSHVDEGRLNVRVNSYSDWGVQAVYGDGNPDNPVDRKNALTIDMLNGSPFTYFKKTSASAATNAFAKVWLRGNQVPGSAPALPVNQVWGRPVNPAAPTASELPANVLALTLTTNNFDASGVLRTNTTSYLVIASDGAWSFRDEINTPAQPPQPQNPQLWVNPLANGTIVVVSMPHQVGQTKFENLSDADKVAVARQLFLPVAANLPVGTPAATKVSDPTPHLETYNNEQILFGADVSSGFVNTRHTVTIQDSKPTLQVLYPHQFTNLFASDRKNYATFTPTSGPDAGTAVRLFYNTSLGRARLYASNEFATQTRFQGTLNDLPNVAVQTDRLAAEAIFAAVESFMTRYIPNPDFVIGIVENTYDRGLMTLSRMLQVTDSLAAPTSLLTAEQQQRATAWRDRLLQDLRTQVLSWFDPATGRLFQLNTTYDTVIGYPAGYGSDTGINDHHFHYGYFLTAFATIGQYNPGFLQSLKSQIQLLVRDIANFDRTDKQLPFLREFNPWAGHSWANGLGQGGNDQESASEAVNAYASMIRLGMLMNEPTLVSQGIYLYQTEVEAMEQYWFNTSANPATGNFGNFPQEFAQYLSNGQPVNVTQIANVKQNDVKRELFYASDNYAEALYAINWVPTAAWTLFLGNNQDYLKRNWAQYLRDYAADGGRGVNQAVVAAYQAMMPDEGYGLDKPGASNALLRLDPTVNPSFAATNQIDPGFVGGYTGTNRAIALDWVYGMKQLGQVDPTVVADTVSYGVFLKDGQRTYTAFNPSPSTPITVTFRDAASGTVLQTLLVNPGQTVTRLADGRLLVDVSLQSRTNAGTSLFLRKPNGQDPDAPSGLTLAKQPGTAVPIQVIAENPSQGTILDAYASTYTLVPKRPGDATAIGNAAPADAAGINAFTITGVNGVYRPGGQTGLEVFLNNALTWNEDPNPDPSTKPFRNEYGPGVVFNNSFAASTAVLEVGYDFEGDGVYDRVETYTRELSGVNRFELVGNLTPVTGIIDPNVPDGRPALDPSLSRLTPFEDMTNGAVQVRFWQGTWATGNNSHKEYAVSVNSQRGLSRQSRVVIPFDDLDSGPQVLLVAPPPKSVTNQPVATLTARLSQPAVVGAFTAASLTLTRDGQPVALPETVTVTRIGTSNDYTIDGLAAVNAQPGAYVLTVVGAKIQTGGSKPGTGTAAASWSVDLTGPGLQLLSDSPQPTNAGPITVTALFSEPVVGFNASSVKITNGTATNFRGAGRTYAFDVTPSQPGVTVTASAAAGAGRDAAGNASSSATFSRDWYATGPSVRIASTVGAVTNLAKIPVTVTFSTPVTGFAASSLVVDNATIDGFPTGSTGAVYSFFLVPKATGRVTLDVPAGAAVDASSQRSAAAATFAVRADSTAPAGVLTSIASYVTYVSSIPVVVLFSEPVTGFTAAKIVTANGSVTNFRGSGDRYAFDLVPDDLGVVSASVPAGAVMDAAGNTNAVLPVFSRNFKLIPTASITTTAVTPTSATTIPMQIAFNQAMALDTSKIGVVNGTIIGGAVTSIDGAVYTFNVQPTASPVTINLPALAATNAVGAGNPNAQLMFNWGPAPVIKSFQANQLGASPSYTVTLVFDQPVNGLDASKLAVLGDAGAWISDVTGGGTTYNVTVTPKPKPGAFGQSMAPNFQVNPGSITSDVGVLNGTGTGNAVQFTTLSITGPTMIMTSPVPTKTARGPIPVTVQFSEPVKNFTAEKLSPINGTISNFQQPDPGDASRYTFTLTPTLDGGTAVVPNASGVVSVTGDVQVMTPATSFNRTVASPVVTGITSTAADGTYGFGDTIPIEVTFSLPVKVVGTPLLALNSRGSTLAAFATFDRVSADGKTLTYVYKPAAGQMATRLNADSQSALRYFPGGANILDAATNQPMSGDAILVATEGTGSLAGSRAIVIDTARVTSVLDVTSPKANGFYATGETIPIVVRFSRPVVVTGTPMLPLNTGFSAGYVSGSGSDALVFEFSVAANQRSLHLDYTSATAFDQPGRTWSIRDQADNPISLTLPEPGTRGSLSFNRALGVAGAGPRVLALTSTAANNATYGIGKTLQILVGFDAAVAVTGAPTLRLNSGGTAVYLSGTGTSTLTFTYTVAAGQQTPSLDAADAAALEGGTIRDFARNPEDRPSFIGNEAIRTLPAPGAAGSLSNVSDNRNLRIAGVPPKVLAVFSPVNGLRTDGGAFQIDVKFDGQMAKPTGGTPTLQLSNGDEAEFTGIESDGKGAGNTLKFLYNPRSDAAPDGRGIDAVSLQLNGATLKDVAGNDAVLTLPAAGAAGSLSASNNIVIKTNALTAPVVVDVQSSIPFGTTFGAGAQVPTTVTFSEPVTVTGTPQLALAGGGFAMYTRGSGSRVLSFVYTVGAGQNAARLDYSTTAALTAPGGTIRSIFGTFPDANLTLPAPGKPGSLGFNERITIDTATLTTPSVVEVTAVNPAGLYRAGQTVLVQVVFDRAVTVTAAADRAMPKLLLRSGVIVEAAYQSGSGTRILTFAYTIAAGQAAAALNYVTRRSLELNGATIKDAVNGRDAALTLPLPGLAGSLRADRLIVVQP
jgi:hypothetical protein